ncbi:MAG: NAD(P)-dependent oxidoreductase [Betaproteobacteria bacterium]
MRFGYVGIGLMGLPMTRRLIETGHEVRVFDIDPVQMGRAREAGAGLATSPADACSGADAVLLNLPTDEAVELAVTGPDGVTNALRPPQRLVDFSTVSVEQGARMARTVFDQCGCIWIDAPVSGGPPASAAGRLTVMAGGPEADIAALAPLWGAVAARLTRMGDSGAGLAAKMINQLIVGCGNAVLAEAHALAAAAGIDAARLPECLAGGHADSELLRQIYPRMAERDFAPRGYARQLLKDLEAVSRYAGSLKTPTPMMAQAQSLFRLLILKGYAELDTSAIVRVYDKNPPKEETR